MVPLVEVVRGAQTSQDTVDVVTALLELAANVPLNEINIDLVGLQQSGVEFV